MSKADIFGWGYKYRKHGTTTKTAEELVEMGYRLISTKYRLIARIDRPDYLEYLEHMAEKPEHTVEFFKNDFPGKWQGYYRRKYSLDCLKVSPELVSKIPWSGTDPTGYVELCSNKKLINPKEI